MVTALRRSSVALLIDVSLTGARRIKSLIGRGDLSELEGFPVIAAVLPPSPEPGRRLREVREHLALTYRAVVLASQDLVTLRNDERLEVSIARLSEIENTHIVPSIHTLYALCHIYGLDLAEALSWYGFDTAESSNETSLLMPRRSDTIGSYNPNVDLSRTSFVSRMIENWAALPKKLLGKLEPQRYRYATVGTEDRRMYPLIPPGSLVVVDENKRTIERSSWSTEFERPIYLILHKAGYTFGWCSLSAGVLTLESHPVSSIPPESFSFPRDIEVIGQVTGVTVSLPPNNMQRLSLGEWVLPAQKLLGQTFGSPYQSTDNPELVALTQLTTVLLAAADPYGR